MTSGEPALIVPAAAPPAEGWWGTSWPILLSLALGIAGAASFNFLTLPLPWMLGPMAFTTVAAIAGVPLNMPKLVRNGTSPVIGVMLGSAFTPDVVARLAQWGLTGSGLVLWLTLCTASAYLWFRRFARYDRVTSFFSATPGGLAEMTLVGAQMGGDVRIIPLVHSTRVLICVFTIPVWYRFSQHLPPVAAAARVGLADVPVFDYLALAFCAVTGALAAGRLRIPSAALLGPMALSAAFHLLAITSSRPPFVLVAAAQVAIGSMVGTRFVGFPPRRVASTALHAAVTAAFILGLTVLFSEVLAAVTGFPVAALVLAFAPGGLTEMSLMALALHVDTAFVAGHHMLRVVLVTMVAPQIFLLLRRWRTPGPGD